MKSKNLPIVMMEEFSQSKVHFIRGELVVLDTDLAKFFETQTSQINRSVKRNKERFPDAFMFQLTEDEFLQCQNGTSTAGQGGRRTLPYAFTEMGCWTLSLILTSKKAKVVGVELLKTFKVMKDHLRENPNSLPVKLQKALSSKSATINLYDSPHSIIIVGESVAVDQKFSSIEEVLPSIKALLPLVSKEDSDVAKAVRELVEVMKEKDQSKIKDSVSVLSDAVNIAKDGGAAVLAVRALLAGLGIL